MVNMSNYILWLLYFRKPNHSKQYDFNYSLGEHNIQHSVGHVLQLNVVILEILLAISTHTLPFTQLEERLRTTLLNWYWSYSPKRNNDHVFLTTMVAKLLTKIWRQIINNKTLIIFKTLSSCSLTITFVTKIPFFFFLILFFLLSYTYTQRVLKKLQPHLASILMREGSAIWAKSLLARPRPPIFTFTKLLFSVF